MHKTMVKLDKPVIVGQAILDLSKTLMYDFWYNDLKKKYQDKIRLLMTDTDSLLYEVETEDIYKDMAAGLKNYDTSDYPRDHFLQSNLNKKVIGKFKDETNGAPIREFCGLRAKMYSFTVGDDEKKRGKGIKKAVVKKVIRHSDYLRALFGDEKSDKQQKASFRQFKSVKHDIQTIQVTKVGLCSYDDKAFMINRLQTIPYGHYSLAGGCPARETP